MPKIVQLLKHGFTKYPVLSNAAIYGTLFVGAEFSQQIVTRKILVVPDEKCKKPLDGASLQRYAIFGTCIQGPLLTVWYRWLDGKYVGTAYRTVVKKVLIDQFLMTPNLVAIFFIAMSVMERKQDVLEECREKFVPTFQKSCMFWLPATFTNFLFIPPQFRVVYVGTCALVWVNILCFVKRQ